MLLDNSHVEYETVKTRHYFQQAFEKHEKLLVIVLCMIAMMRIFIFSAAFPFFNNVDEQYHFDTVVKHARGYLPCKECNQFDQESVKLIVRYGTPEYFTRSSILSRLPVDPVEEETWLIIKNHEAFSPPIYYMITGAWFNLGKLIGIQGGYLLYWIRFMNLPIFALLLLITYLYCRYTEPNNLNLRIGVVLLLSFFPEDVFYSINSDVLSPLFFLGWLFLMTIIFVNNQRFWLYPLAGVMIASTILVKLSNIPALFIFSIMLFLLVKKICSMHQVAKYATRILAMLTAAAVPIVVWGSLNYYNLGNITGTYEKIASYAKFVE
jgi:hypothetical protein